jgi:hypothetical protein
VITRNAVARKLVADLDRKIDERELVAWADYSLLKLSESDEANRP